MIAHFSANHNHSAVTIPGCLDPQSCLQWSRNIEDYMNACLEQAEQAFTDFLRYDPHRIICLDDQVVEAVDRFGLSWRAFAQTIRESYLLEWYDREELVPLLTAQQKKSQQQRRVSTRYQQMTWRSGRNGSRALRPRSVQDLDARSEYRMTPGRYRIVLRCLFPDAPLAAPLLVEATYDIPSSHGETWALHIGAVMRPVAEKWNADYTSLLCRCHEDETERITSNAHLSSPSLFA